MILTYDLFFFILSIFTYQTSILLFKLANYNSKMPTIQLVLNC